MKSIGIEKKKSRSEKRKEKRHQQEEITSKISEQFTDKAAITMLTEGHLSENTIAKDWPSHIALPRNNPNPSNIHQTLLVFLGTLRDCMTPRELANRDTN